MALWTLAPPQQSMVGDAALATWTSSAPAKVTLTADSTSHTKGVYAEIEDATTTEWAGFTIATANTVTTSNTVTSILLDIAVGAAGSELVVVGNLPIGYTNYKETVHVPLRIPAGVRVAGRIQGAVISEALDIAVTPWAGAGFTGSGGYQCAVSFGADEANSRGQTVSASASANVFGSWAVIAATTSAPIRAMVVGVQANSDADIGNSAWRLEIGFGAAGVEQTVASIGQLSGSTELMSYGSVQGRTTEAPPLLLRPTVAIPEGARLVARVATSTSNTSLTAVDVVIIGLR